MTVHRRRKGLLLAKSEGTEGTAETLAAADQHHLVYDLAVTPDIQKFVRKPFLADLGVLPPVIGKKSSAIAGRFEFKGHGNAAGTVTDTPEWDVLLKAMGFQVETLEQITIGAITGGPYVDGETITGGTSSATGVVFKRTVDGTTTLLFVTTSGTFQTAETITGSTSSASATSGSVPSDYGLLYRMDSNGGTSATIAAAWNYGTATNTQVKIAGARSNLIIVANTTGEPVFGEFSFVGKLVAVGEFALTPAQVPDDKQPLPFLGVGLTLGGLDGQGSPGDYTPVFSSFRLDMQSQAVPRDDSNDSTGIKSTIISDWEPVWQIDPELAEEGSWDFYQTQTEGVIGRTGFQLGFSPDLGVGRRVELHLPTVAVTDWDLSGDRQGIQIVGLTGGCFKDGVTGFSDRAVCLVSR